MSNFDILYYVKKLGISHFRGVFMRNKLPRSGPWENESAILNLDSSEGLGSHWTAFLKRGSKVIYYNSFGVPPPIEVQEYFINSVIFYNCEQDQQMDEVICGHLCLKFLANYETTEIAKKRRKTSNFTPIST